MTRRREAADADPGWRTGHEIEWSIPGGSLTAVPAAPADVSRRAAQLASWYNDEHNRSMLANTMTLTRRDVELQFATMRAAGDHVFLLHEGGDLVGDADLRHMGESKAEFAIMIGEHGRQGAGLGTRFSIMIHAYAFCTLRLSTVYLSFVPANVAARHCYEKVGYAVDETCAARRYADDPTDVTMSLARDAFLARHARALDEIAIRPARRAGSSG
jgi:RimJ/RimL family protein N-acetyltransferase